MNHNLHTSAEMLKYEMTLNVPSEWGWCYGEK